MKKHLLCILSLVLLLSLFSFVGCNSGKDIHVHKFTTSVVDATCTTAGEKVYICDCGKTDVAEIPALGHSFKDGFCTRCGAVDLDNHEHIWTGPTCTEPQICELCSKTQGEPLGHAVVTDSRVDPTCTETGLTEGSHCSRCGDTLVAQEVIGATGHRYEDSNECNVCGHIDTQYFTFTLLSDDTYEIKAKDVNNIPAHVVIPDFYMDKAVTCIGMHAFAYCNNLQSVAIGINVTSIDFCAFYSCNSLTSIFIPDGVAAIGIGAFGYCKSLGNIQVAENNAMYTDIDGNLYSKDGKVLIQYAIAKQAIAFAIPDGVNTVGSGSFAGCDNLKMVVIPNSVNQIDSQVFYTCTSLTSVIIPNSVTSIGAQAFEGCISLSSIVIGNNVATIGSLAFKYCDSLTNIVIPNSVTTIGSEAFWNCFNLTSIVIGHNIATIEAGAFEYCSALICVYYNGSESKWADINIGTSNTELLSAIYYYSEEHPTTEGNFWHYDENGEIAVWCYNPVIDSAVESTCTETGLTEGSHCSRCGETLVAQEEIPVLPHTYENSNQCSVCEYIDTQYFTFTLLSDDTYSLYAKDVNNIPVEVVIPSVYNGRPVTTIRYYAFYYCESLNSIVVPDSIVSIGYHAFRDCSNLKEIVIPESLISVGEYAFHNCGKVKTVYITSINAWCSIDFQGESSNPLRYDTTLYLSNEIISGKIVLEDSVISIPSYTFSNSLITEITIPNSVKSIEGSAFSNCDLLTSVAIPDGVTSIGGGAFDSCDLLTTVEIPASVTSIAPIPGSIPQGAIVIQTSPFKNCNSLTSINYLGTIEEWLQIDFNAPLFTRYGTEIKINGEIVTEVNITRATKISKYAFYNFNRLTSVVMGDSVTSIGAEAFYNCTSLTSVVIGNNVTSIGPIPNGLVVGFGILAGCNALEEITIPFVGETKDATVFPFFGHLFRVGQQFDNCCVPESLKKVTITGGEQIPNSAFYGCSSLTEIVIRDGVTSIGDSAFSGCNSLTKVIIPGSVTSIGYSAFSGCGSLTGIVIPDNVTSIGSYAFNDCSSLTEIVIPDSVTSIGSFAFSDCNGLTSITIPFVGSMLDGTSNTYFGSIFGGNSLGSNDYRVPTSLKTVVVTGGSSIGEDAFYGCSSLTEIIIPDSITSIGYRAFSGCSSLTEIVIPDSVTDIGNSAFYGCSSLTKIVIPDSVTSIGNNAFSGCSSLVTVNFGENRQLTDIGDSSFSYCESLTEIVIPDSVTSIGGYAFYGCSGLVTVNFGENSQLTSIGEYAFHSCSSLTEIVIPDSVTSIGEYAFYGCDCLKNIYITDVSAWCEISGLVNLMTYGLGNKNFYLNNQLMTELIIPDGVTSVSDFAFYHCSGFTEIVIPNSVTIVGKYAFVCTTTTSLIIGNGVTTVGETAFLFESLENLTLPARVIKKILNRNFRSVVITEGDIPIEAFCEYKELQSVILREGVTSIGDRAFIYCSNLTEIEIPDSVTSIGSGAFFDCSSLDTITFKENSQLTSIGGSAFAYCNSLAEIVIPDSVTSIGDGAFQGCSRLERVVVGDGLTFISDCIFYDCSSLKSIEIPDSVTGIGNQAFSGCTSLASIKIPDGVATIGFPFDANTPLTSVIVPSCAISILPQEKLTTVVITSGDIPECAFLQCLSLQTVVISDGVTSIGYSAFEGCTGLTNISISDSVTTIGDFAFRDCRSLVSVEIPDSVTSVGWYAFAGCDNLQFNIEGNLKYLGNNSNPYLYLFGSISTDITTVKINENCKIIGYDAFFNCSSLTEIVIPDSVTDIGDGAFCGCSSLTEIIIPDSITSIDDSAFAGCSSLTEIVIPDSITSIGGSAFYGCGSLTRVFYKRTVDEWAQITIESRNEDLTEATIYYYSEQEPAAEGNYWHYDENGDIAVWGAQG